MGYRSNVKLLISKEGYNMLEEACKNSDKDYIREMVESPAIFDDTDDDYTIIGWMDVKWYLNYEDVKAVMNVLSELDDLVEENEEELEKYFYKMIKIGEDNATEEWTNDYDEEYTSHFYVECNFSL